MSAHDPRNDADATPDLHDDPRLTAYALGELSSDEAADIAALIERDPHARELVDALRATATELTDELRTEANPALHDAQRANIVRRAGAATGVARYLAAAAALVVSAGALALYQVESSRERDSSGMLASAPAETPEYRGPLDTVPAKPTASASPDTSRDAGRAGGGGPGGGGPMTRGPGGPGTAGSGPGGPGGPGGGPAAAGGVGFLTGSGRKNGAVMSRRTVPNSEVALRAVLEGSTEDRRRSPPRSDDLKAAEEYDRLADIAFRRTVDDARSTFSTDVDTASYSNARRYLSQGQLPPPESVRIEEFVNYFPYSDAPPTGAHPFAVSTEIASCPWEPRHQLVRIGLKGQTIDMADRPAVNLVFLLDVSGSMNSPDKLPLLKRSMKLLVEQLEPRDRVAIVVYAGASGLVLPSTPGSRAFEVLAALDQLQAGGSTNGGAGIELAYGVAEEHFIEHGINRVLLATDGDFNVGVTSRDALIELIEEKRRTGVFLSVLGFGQGNLKDSQMEQIADHGNGAYAYIDSVSEARKVLVEEMGGTLLPIAKDVKIQVEFNPEHVQAWRLVGYENRILAHQDFDDDTKDAGEIGAGMTCTAIYEVVPRNQPLPASVATPETAAPDAAPPTDFHGELMRLRLRYKLPHQEQSRLIEQMVLPSDRLWHNATTDFRFAAAVSGFALLLRGSEHAGDLTFDDCYRIAFEARGEDPGGYRAEFLELVKKAIEIQAR